MKRKILSIILILCMLLSIAPLTVIAADDTKHSLGNAGDIIEFGSYPKTLVTNATLLNELYASGLYNDNMISYNYYVSGQPNENCMWYKDFVYKGEKYRAVEIREYRPFHTYVSSSQENSNQFENGFMKGCLYFFKFEPLRWRVLDPKNGIVMCNDIIDSQPYQNVGGLDTPDGSYYTTIDGTRYYSATWSVSTLRTWLNNDFFNTAFTQEETKLISTSTLDNTYGGTTEDKIYLLSRDDILNVSYGFHYDDNTTDSAKLLNVTDYAKCQGICLYDPDYAWYLRTAKDTSSLNLVYGQTAKDAGSFRETGFGTVPAFKFDMNSVSSSVSVSYDLDGGKWAEGYTAPTSYARGETLSLPASGDVKRAGYTFAGWELVSSSFNDVSYKAKWTENKYSFTVYWTYNDIGKSTSDVWANCYKYGEDVTNTFFYRIIDGTELVCEKLCVKIADENGVMHEIDKSKYIVDTVNTYIKIPGEIVTGDIEIYFERDWKNYTVKFDSNGGTAVADKTLHWNDKVLDGVTEPTRDDGFEFVGWWAVDTKPYPVEQSTTYAEVAGNSTVNSITLTAAWKDVVAPDILDIENGKTYCGAQKFRVSDNGTVAAVIIGNTLGQPDNDGYYTAPAADGAYEIKVVDAGANETKITVTVNADHNYGDWKFDDVDHWKECANGDSIIEKGEHTFEWITDKEASESEAGVKHEECSVCHAMRNENTEIPRIPTKWEKIKAWFVDLFTKIIKWIVDVINTVC